MEILLSTGTVHPQPIEKAFRLANELGFDGIELLIDNKTKLNECEKLNNEYNNIKSIHMPFYPWKWHNLKEFVTILKPENIVAHPTPPKKYLLWTLKKLNIPPRNISIETLQSWKHVLNKEVALHSFIWTIKGYLKFAQKNGFSITVDTSHIFTYKTNPIITMDILKNKTTNIHISDCDNTRLHSPLGSGVFPFEKFSKIAKNVKFVTLELSRVNVKEIKDSLEKIKELF